MKTLVSILAISLLLAVGCSQKKADSADELAQKGDPHAGMDMSKNPHAGQDMSKMMGQMPQGEMPTSGGLDLEALNAKLPEGWSKSATTSSMRLAQYSLAPAKGDNEPGEIAVFHFPGTGGSTAANIERWQNQMTGPKGEPGPSVAKTDTMMVGLLTVITTDLTGTQLASGMMSAGGDSKDKPNMRMIASVVETPAGNYFFKGIGPVKTMAAHEAKFREFLKRAKVKEGGANPHM
jgi:hypothetical protein